MYKRFFKRTIDFSVSLLGLIVTSPILLIVATALAVVNGGIPFFLQERPGKGGRPFRIVKFKTMNDKRDTGGNLLPDRERLTAAGKLVRKTSIDEIPQLINVLKGDMSLVGPRPLLARYLPYYTEREQLRHKVRPGMTGLAQVSGRNTLGWDEKLEFDAHYAENVTFAGDMQILFKTLLGVIKSDGVIADKKENYLDQERFR